MPPLNSGNTRAQGTNIKPKFVSVGLSNSFFPKFAELLDKSTWSSDIPDFKSKIKLTMKPKRHKHFSAGNKYANSLHCRLRVGRIFFNSHGFAIILTTSDKCSFCNKAETVKHYFFSCSKFKDQQNTLFSSILQIFPEFANKSIENKSYFMEYFWTLLSQTHAMDSLHSECKIMFSKLADFLKHLSLGLFSPLLPLLHPPKSWKFYSGTPLLVAQYCGAEGPTVSGLRPHTRRRKGLPSPLQCSICVKIFRLD